MTRKQFGGERSRAARIARLREHVEKLQQCVAHYRDILRDDTVHALIRNDLARAQLHAENIIIRLTKAIEKDGDYGDENGEASTGSAMPPSARPQDFPPGFSGPDHV